MRYAGWACLAASILAVGGCANPPPSGSPGNGTPQASTPPVAPATVVNTPPRIVRRFVGIPMPPNNVLDLDRTVVVGDDARWLGRIFLAAPMTIDQTIEFYRRDMPRYGWTELAVTRSDTSVLAYQMGDRLATIELKPEPSGGRTRIEFWVNPLSRGGQQQAAQPPAAVPQVIKPTPAVPASLPWGPVDGARRADGGPAVAPAPRTVEQAPLPPPASR